METNEMEPRPRDEGRQALQKFKRRYHHMRGPIPVGRFELAGKWRHKPSASAVRFFVYFFIRRFLCVP